MLNFINACINLDPIALIQTGGYIGISFLIFAESGLLIGIFFPGDSLLFAAGLLAAGNILSFGPLLILVILAAILGDSVGYWFGAKAGQTLLNRPDSRFFKHEYIERTETFYQKYGGRAVVLARFVPIVRTIAPILAGVSSMTYRTFLSYNIVGGCLWGAGMTSLGYFLGSVIPNSEHYILPISLVIIVLSFLPVLIESIQKRKTV